MLAEIQALAGRVETSEMPVVMSETSDLPSTTTEDSQGTQETTDTTTDETTPDGAGLAYASVITMTALGVVAMVL